MSRNGSRLGTMSRNNVCGLCRILFADFDGTPIDGMLIARMWKETAYGLCRMLVGGNDVWE